MTESMVAFCGADRAVYFDDKVVGSLEIIRTDLKEENGLKRGMIVLIAFSNLKEELEKINTAEHIHITHRNDFDDTLTITIKHIAVEPFVFNATNGPEHLEVVVPFAYAESVVDEYRVDRDFEARTTTVVKL